MAAVAPGVLFPPLVAAETNDHSFHDDAVVHAVNPPIFCTYVCEPLPIKSGTITSLSSVDPERPVFSITPDI